MSNYKGDVMYQLIVKISVISLVLLSNTVLFSMKRTREAVEAFSMRRHVKPTINYTQEYLDEAFAYSMPSLNLAEMLNKVTIPNVTVDQLPVLSKFALFNKIIQPKLKNIDEVQAKR